MSKATTTPATTTLNGHTVTLTPTEWFHFELPEFHGVVSTHTVYTVATGTPEQGYRYHGYLVRTTHTTTTSTGETSTHFRTSGRTGRLGVGVKSRAAALRKLIR